MQQHGRGVILQEEVWRNTLAKGILSVSFAHLDNELLGLSDEWELLPFTNWSLNEDLFNSAQLRYERFVGKSEKKLG
jgi:hypothetical protein